MSKFRSLVVAKLPKAGLGNKLLVWAEAFVYSSKNNLRLYIKGLNVISIGPLLRGERVKRFYWGQFKRNSPAMIIRYIIGKTLYKRNINDSPNIPQDFSIYEFNMVPHWSDYFEKFKSERALIIKAFESLFSRSSKRLFLSQTYPVVACHIRMGDFKKLPANTDFKTVGATRTPLHYFVQTISQVRILSGIDLQVTIFTDGYPEDLKEVLALGNIRFHEPVNEIVDMLLMSKAKLIITSAGSTFGYWAGFLSEAILIRHPDHFHKCIRDERTNQMWYEGIMDTDNDTLSQALRGMAIN